MQAYNFKTGICKCQRCGYDWVSRKLLRGEKDLPCLCPHCHSSEWERRAKRWR